MYRYNYPAGVALVRALRRFALLSAGLILFFVAVELLRAYHLFSELNLWLGRSFGILVLTVVLILLIRLMLWRQDRQTLSPPRKPADLKPRHDDLTAGTVYLIHRLKRLSLSQSLPPDVIKKLRQKAYDLEGLLGSHPLLDDLIRANSRAEIDTLEPAFALLDQQALLLGKEKIRCVIEDAVEPPFPIVTPLAVLYHQITLVTAITDLYLHRPSLREYLRVLLDVQHTIRGGDFFRIGQRLFEGVYVNSAPLGRAVDDLGQGITCTWLTWSVAKASIHRCRVTTPWSIKSAVQWMDRQTAESLGVVRDVLISDVLPLLKMRIRHNAGPGIADADGFTEQLTQNLARAVDTVVKGLHIQDPSRAAQLSRRTQPGLEATPHLNASPNLSPSRPWKRRGLFGFLLRTRDRIRYAHPPDGSIS
jgi:hypothetical protein